MKTCPRCNKEKPAEEFSWKDKAKKRRSLYCRECMRAYIREHYKTNTDYYIQKARRGKIAYREETYKKVFDYLSTHSCVDCGEPDPIVLEFDHIKRETKEAAISEMIRFQRPWRVILEEIKNVKCVAPTVIAEKLQSSKDGIFIYGLVKTQNIFRSGIRVPSSAF